MINKISIAFNYLNRTQNKNQMFNSAKNKPDSKDISYNYYIQHDLFENSRLQTFKGANKKKRHTTISKAKDGNMVSSCVSESRANRLLVDLDNKEKRKIKQSAIIIVGDISNNAFNLSKNFLKTSQKKTLTFDKPPKKLQTNTLPKKKKRHTTISKAKDGNMVSSCVSESRANRLLVDLDNKEKRKNTKKVINLNS